MTSPPTRRRGPQAPPPGPRRQASSARKTTRRWTDVAPNEAPVDHLDPGYIATLLAAVDAGELEEVDGRG